MIKLLGLFFLVSACAHSVHQSQTQVSYMPKAINTKKFQDKMITSRSEQFVILWFAFSSEYVEAAYNGLLAACPEGIISPVTTNYTTDLGFLSWTNKVEITGNCITKR